MSLSFLVTNDPPVTTSDVSQSMLRLFQDYCVATSGQAHYPYVHQAQTFGAVARDEEVFLVAGTAAGKTLAIAVPLFDKLMKGHIHKVLLMYPTIALMEDQRRVMETLAQITRQEIGQLQGGMSRTELITALNKPIILATPDEVYWFFRKNVKYSGLLIYGLALADEYVVDEAHLFNGLTLCNLARFKQRVQLLAEKLGTCPRWHVLTATPTHELRSLTNGTEVRGQSKCGDVAVAFLEPARDYDERRDKLVGAVASALSNGAQKVLLVFNSADLAHRVFESIKGKSRPELPPDLQWRFGRIRWGHFKAWLERGATGAKTETIEEIERWLKQEGPFYLKDLGDGARVAVTTEALSASVTRLLQGQVWAMKRIVYSAARQESCNLLEAIEGKLGGQGRLIRILWGAVGSRLQNEADAESVAGVLDAWVSDVQMALERIWVEDSITATAPSFAEIAASLHQAGLAPEAAEKVTDHLKYTVEVPEQAAAVLRMTPEELAERRVAFPWLDWLIKDASERQEWVERARKALEEGELEAEIRHIAVWGDTGIPVVIYTGKMSRVERKGLIEAFSGLPRAVLISTPAVEVGVDFAADTLITEQCDGNSFLQRFGRVGRRPGTQGKVDVLVKDGATYVRLYQRHQPQMSREEFSTLIADPADGIFPARRYAEGSVFLDASHWLINAQLGEIGHRLNQALFEPDTAALAQQLQSASLPFAYGLRGTLPEVALQGSGGGEPFHILRKVSNERLLPGGSPFEMARADMWYLEFLWKKSLWNIAVNGEATLNSSQAIFWWQGGRWHVRPGYGMAADYVRLFSAQSVSQGKSLPVLLKALEPKIVQDLEGLLCGLASQKTKPLPGLLLRVGEALRLFFEPHNRFILGQGDVHLLRMDQDEICAAVEDRFGNPLVLPDQTWLMLYGYTQDEAKERLKEASALELEEVVYDWNTFQVPGSPGVVLVDRVAGACFYMCQRLVEHAGR